MLFAVWVKLEYCINFVKIMIAIFSFSFVQSLKLYNCRGKVYESGANVSISLNTFYDMICIGSGWFTSIPCATETLDFAIEIPAKIICFLGKIINATSHPHTVPCFQYVPVSSSRYYSEINAFIGALYFI